MKQGLASIIIVNLNGVNLLEECLDSLIGQTYKDIEIIVVDNGSKDGSPQLIEKKYPNRVKLIRSAVNVGFSQGNNIGIREAKGEYIILVNNDTKADREFVERLVYAATSDETVGMCASKLLSYANPKIIDAVGMLVYKDGLNQGRGRFQIDNGQYEDIEETIYPPGCGSLYKKKVLDEIGLFDEDFGLLYGEDTDLGVRARLLGWKALYVPGAVMYHKVSQTGGQYSTFKLFYAERNRMFVVFKYYPPLFLISSFYYTAIRYWTQFLSIIESKGASQVYIKKTSPQAVIKTLAHAYISFFVNIPKLVVKRSFYRKKKKITDKEFLDLFKKFGITVKEMVYNA